MATNLKNIVDLVKERLPYLSDGSKDDLIESEKIQVMYWLQPYLKKSDDDVENEDTYKPLEKILISWLVPYNLLNNKSVEIASGSDSSGSGSQNTFLKKAKADVVEAEFEVVDTSKNVTLAQDTEEIKSTFLKQACSIAQTLRLNLSICTQQKYDMVKPFIIVK